MSSGFTAAVLGAAGGIGQPLSLLLSQNQDITTLHLYDVVPVVEGVAKDISHINTNTRVVGYAGSIKDKAKSKEALKKTLTGVDICVIPAGVPRKPGMTRDDLFAVNAGIVTELVEAIAENCPQAYICIISNPVNSTVPIAAEVLKNKGVFNPRRLFGVSTLDVVRANKFVGEATRVNPETVNVPVIGGHSGVTILPILSKVTPPVKFSQDTIEKLTKRIQTAGTEVVEAKQGGGSATLSMAYAGARFAGSVLQGLKGQQNVIECTYVFDSSTQKYFAWPVLLGKSGVEKIMPLTSLSPYEQRLLKEQVTVEVEKGVSKGVGFIKAKL